MRSTSEVQDRWLGIIIWIGVLVALLVSSVVLLPYAVSIAINLRNYSELANAEKFTTHHQIVLIGSAILAGLLGILFLRAWLGFIRFTEDLLVAYSEQHVNEQSSFFDLLLFLDANDVDEEETEEKAESKVLFAKPTVVNRILQPLVWGWIVGMVGIAVLFIIGYVV